LKEWRKKRKRFYVVSIDTIDKETEELQQRKMKPEEIVFLREALNADYRNSNIRLREGEYQHDLAKTIASFQLKMVFPNVKTIIGKLYGEEKTNDVQFIRKIQTILKKMERSDILKILPKKNPWDLQRYALPSFKFQDVDRNLVIFATDVEVKEAQEMLQSVLDTKDVSISKLSSFYVGKILILTLATVLSFSISAWSLFQPIIDPIIFVPTFCVAIICSFLLGKIFSQR
jgi:hypothetical protein